jgi:hypothetical protein
MSEQQVISNDILKILGDVMRRNKYAKKEMCKEVAMSDTPPMLIIGRIHQSDDTDDELAESASQYTKQLGLERQYDVAMLPLIHKEDPYDAYIDAVGHLPTAPVNFIFIAVEGYMRRFTDLTTPADRDSERESLKDEFQNNPFSDVREGLVVSGVDWEQDKVYMSASTYTYDDRGVPMFDDVDTDIVHLTDENSEMAEARFTNAMLQTISYLKMAIKAKAFHTLLTEADNDKEGN